MRPLGSFRCFVFFLMMFLSVRLTHAESTNTESTDAPLPETIPSPEQEPLQEKSPLSTAQPSQLEESQSVIFDDRMLLEGYTQKYKDASRETILAMIKDDTLTPYKGAAAVRVFREHFSLEVFSKEKNRIEKILLQRLNRTNSPFVEVEILHTLCVMDRYQYFASLVPVLIQKMDHYNDAVNELAYAGLVDIIEAGHNRRREARIVFNTLRKTLFLSRKKLVGIKEPSSRLKQKLELLRWSIKILDIQELKRLPKEVINLL